MLVESQSVRRLTVLLLLPAFAIGCGGTDTKRAVARVEVAELATRCSDNAMAAEEGAKTPVRCRVGQLAHLTGTLWRATLAVPGGHLCVTFDAAKYVPGTKNGQSVSSC